MVTKTIPSKPKAKKTSKEVEAERVAEQDSLTPEQEAAVKEKAKALTKKLAEDKGKLTNKAKVIGTKIKSLKAKTAK